MMNDTNYRHLVHTDEHTERVGKEGAGSAGGISCLGVHTKDISALENLVDRADQVHICCKLSGTDGADPFHKPGAAIVAVYADNVVDTVGISALSTKLEIYEIMVVAEKDIRRLEAFHIYLFNLVFFVKKKDL